MQDDHFLGAIRDICKADPRYTADAYFFIREALDHTSRTLDKPTEGEARHVTGTELLDGIRRYTLQEYGPMSLTVLASWGIRRTDDFGELVFNLVERGILGSTAEDKKQDFAGGYDFQEAFAKPFKPQATDSASNPDPDRPGSRRKPPKPLDR